MREIFTEIFENQPLDPTEAARQAMRPRLRKRFYKHTQVDDADAGNVAILLDHKPVLTPLRRPLAAPTRALAQAIAAEWEAQVDVIDPARMPLTRLANAVIDAVSETPQPVADEIAKYLGTDLLCYRADSPAGLIEKQSRSLGPGARLGAKGIRRAICTGAGRHACAATARRHCRYASGYSERSVATGCDLIDHDADRVLSIGPCNRAWRTCCRCSMDGRAC